MNLEELRKLADSFFEWPTEDRTHVTLTSALLFAQHVLRMTQQQSDKDRLRFRSACEISGDKHPEYVRGYEAAMDAVCKAQPAPRPIPTSERLPTEADADCDGRVWVYGLDKNRWIMTHWMNARRGDYWLPTGLTRPAEPGGE